ncbi:MAG: glycosyltransferase [Myxococcota bacterium]|nr:glycosyltransferase [Myxococcota bacterium]
MPLHIVQAAAFPFPSPQGSQVYVAGMARALARRGHRVTVACYHHGQGELPEGIEVLRTPRVPGYNNMRAGPDWVKPGLDLAMALQLSTLHRRTGGRPPDILHAHNYEAPLAAYIARRFTGVPVVYNNHNTMGEELHRYFEHPLAQRAARRLGRVLDLQIPRRADASVAISQSALPILEGLGCRRVEQIPPGVDLEDFEGADGARARAEHGFGDRVWVVYAGNPDAYQDLEILIEAMLSVSSLGLVMVSASPLTEWERLAAELPAARKRFLLREDWAQVRDIIAAADIAALPRTVCSGYPIKLLNYLGLGLPTVASEGSAQALPGVVSVPNHDPQAFAAALVALAQDAERRRELGEQARAGVARSCTWDAQAARLEALYLEILSGGAAPSAG